MIAVNVGLPELLVFLLVVGGLIYAVAFVFGKGFKRGAGGE